MLPVCDAHVQVGKAADSAAHLFVLYSWMNLGLLIVIITYYYCSTVDTVRTYCMQDSSDLAAFDQNVLLGSHFTSTPGSIRCSSTYNTTLSI